MILNHRNATLIAVAHTKCYCLNKIDFQKSIGAMVKKNQEKRLSFFQECFKNIVSLKSMSNFMVMFQPEDFNRGEFICRRGDLLAKMFVIEQGEVGIISSTRSDMLKKNSKVANLMKTDFVK